MRIKFYSSYFIACCHSRWILRISWLKFLPLLRIKSRSDFAKYSSVWVNRLEEAITAKREGEERGKNLPACEMQFWEFSSSFLPKPRSRNQKAKTCLKSCAIVSKTRFSSSSSRSSNKIEAGLIRIRGRGLGCKTFFFFLSVFSMAKQPPNEPKAVQKGSQTREQGLNYVSSLWYDLFKNQYS